MVMSWALAEDTHKKAIPQNNSDLQKCLMSFPLFIGNSGYILLLSYPDEPGYSRWLGVALLAVRL